MHVVVLDEYQMPLQVAVFAQVDNVLDVAFPIVIARVGFAGEDELNGPLLVPREADDVVQLLENQRRALIGRKPARETNGQRVRVEQLIEGNKVPVRQSLALNQEPPPGKLDELAAQPVAQGPDFFVGNELRVRQSLPEF